MTIVLLGMLLITDANLKKQLIVEEECDVETNDIIQSKTITLIKK